MNNMYDKLGDMLNDVLESGKIPEPIRNTEKEQKQKENQNIKLENLPEKIQKAFIYLECSPEMTIEEVRKVYHSKLKEVHPDKTTIQTSETDNKSTHYTVQNLNTMYKILTDYYTKL